jgi:hypothetical protein
MQEQHSIDAHNLRACAPQALFMAQVVATAAQAISTFNRSHRSSAHNGQRHSFER